MTKEELKAYKEANPKSQAKNTKDDTLFLQGGLTYIETKKNERLMGKCFDIGAYSQSLAWGNFMELIVFSLIGMDYSLTHKGTVKHPTLKHLAGTTDAIKYKAGKKHAAAEIKCYEPKNWAAYTNVLLKQDIELLKSEFPQEYWQIVSNADILGVKYGEAITFMPYESQMEDKYEGGELKEMGIRTMAENYDSPEQWMYRFISEKPNWQLPVLPDGGYYKNINKFEFLIPKEDTEFLRHRVNEATKLLLAK